MAAWIREQIRAAGPVTVARFMEWALYHPQYGYYTGGPNIGPRGDFTTSPEASPIFGRLLARHMAEIDELLGGPPAFDLIEYGPGRGTLASDLLDTAAERYPGLYSRLRYWLIEISPALQFAQREKLLLGHAAAVRWASSTGALGPGMTGAAVANEFVDAYPVHVVENRGGELLEQYVEVEQSGSFGVTFGQPSDPALLRFLTRFGIALEPGQRIEINLGGSDWLEQLASVFMRGVVTIIDYGDTQPGRYSESRRDGTLLGYYGGAVTADFLAHPGRQDLTALVDFTALSESATGNGFSLVGMTRQANFLIGLGLGTDDTVESGATDLASVIARRKGFQALISMEGLGRFQVMLLAKGVDSDLARRTLAGLRYLDIG